MYQITQCHTLEDHNLLRIRFPHSTFPWKQNLSGNTKLLDMQKAYLELCLHLRLSAPPQKTIQYKLRRIPAAVVKRKSAYKKM
jgi:hypothetical protein